MSVVEASIPKKADSWSSASLVERSKDRQIDSNASRTATGPSLVTLRRSYLAFGISCARGTTPLTRPNPTA
jgi:hypothetical protein